jgi:methyl-accepting chemotaxis protein
LTWLREISRLFFVRLLCGIIGIALVLSVALSFVLTDNAATSLSSASSSAARNLAVGNAGKIELWVGERLANVSTFSLMVRGHLGDPDLSSQMQALAQANPTFEMIEVVDTSGNPIASSAPNLVANVGAASWFKGALAKPVIADVTDEGATLRWFVAAPIAGADNKTSAVLVGDAKVSAMANLLYDADVSLTGVADVDLVNAQHRLVYSTDMGDVADNTALRAKGAMQEVVKTAAADLALGSGAGTVRFREHGTDTLAGYDHVDTINWGVIVPKPASVALKPVDDLRVAAFILVLVGLGVAVVFAVVFARLTTRPVSALAAAARKVAKGDFSARVTPSGSVEVATMAGDFNLMVETIELTTRPVSALAEAARQVAKGDFSARVTPSGPVEVATLAADFNRMVETIDNLVQRLRGVGAQASGAATQLASAAEEMAATTSEQSASVTETSASMEELARTSASIADTINHVAVQAGETRENIEQAHSDIEESSQRNLALTERVNEINAILDLINEIADQTNLLALNAAIEAARAGEQGRGFAVVADEVRRLAERSKSSAAEITAIVEGAQKETNATVMAMEKGGKQLQRGLGLMEDLSDAASQVRLTTQQQQTATEQVMEAMEQVSVGSRQMAATAQEIAAAASKKTELANDLELAAVSVSGGR